MESWHMKWQVILNDNFYDTHMKKIKISALLLAAGYGSRLRPLTYKVPKCMVKIGNQPILERWLTELEKVGCGKAIINTHYLREQVDAYLGQRSKSKLKIMTTYEKELLGTAGTL